MSKRISDFQAFDDAQSQNFLASHAPKGRLFGRKYREGSIIYRLFLCLSTFVKTVTGQAETLTRNLDSGQAAELLEEWESALGIPDKYPRRDTISGRREAVWRKRSKVPVYNVQTQGSAPLDTTIEEYVRKMTGINITISFLDRESTFPNPFPIEFFLSGGTNRLYYVISVPVEGSSINNAFPIPFPASFFEPQVPQAVQDLLDIVLDDVIPSCGDWTYVADVQ